MAEHKQHIYKTGTLSYTNKSLGVLFFWLMVGDFCSTMESSVDPSILPFMLKKLSASNTIIAIFIITIPSLLNVILNPIISTASDRYRSKFGRRIPFLAIATPFITITLILTGYAPQIGVFIQKTFGISKVIPVALIFLSTIIVLYRIAFLFVNTTFYYLFNDIVPEEVMGRFTTGFRIFGLAASSAFSFFGFKYVESYPQYVCIAGALIYLVGFGFMCFKIKEGNYPPPSDSLKTPNPLKLIKTYARECFCHRIYIYYFLAYSFVGLFYVSSPFLLLMFKESMHISLGTIGIVGGITGIVSFTAIIPAGFLIDKYHPIRVYLASVTAFIILYSGIVIWAFIQNNGNMVPFLVCSNLVIAMCYGAASTALWPLGMRLVPRTHYGQFSSAAAMVGSFFGIGGGIIIGLFLDTMKKFYHGNLFYYRWALLWAPTVCLISLIFMYITYNLWKNMGGDEGYIAPTAETNKLSKENKCITEN